MLCVRVSYCGYMKMKVSKTLTYCVSDVACVKENIMVDTGGWGDFGRGEFHKGKFRC